MDSTSLPINAPLNLNPSSNRRQAQPSPLQIGFTSRLPVTPTSSTPGSQLGSPNPYSTTNFQADGNTTNNRSRRFSSSSGANREALLTLSSSNSSNQMETQYSHVNSQMNTTPTSANSESVINANTNYTNGILNQHNRNDNYSYNLRKGSLPATFQQSNFNLKDVKMNNLSFLKLPIASWSIKEVCSWLTSYQNQESNFGNNPDLSFLAPVFKEHEVSGEVLLELDHYLLKQMGVSTVGTRVRLLTAIKSLRRNQMDYNSIGNPPIRRSQPPNNYSPDHVTRLMKTANSAPFLGSDMDNIYNSNQNEPVQFNYRYQIQNSGEPSRNRPGSQPASKYDFNKPIQKPEPPGVSPVPKADIMSLNNVKSRCVKVAGEGGQSSVVDLQNALHSPEAILQKVLNKFSLPGPPEDYAIFIGSGETTRILSDTELMEICNSLNHPSKDKFILRKRYNPLSNKELQQQRLRRHVERKQERLRQPPLPMIPEPETSSASAAPTTNVAGFEVPLPPLPTILKPEPQSELNLERSQSKVFARRPPSQMIESNLSKYFNLQESPRLSTNKILVPRASILRSSLSQNYVPRAQREVNANRVSNLKVASTEAAVVKPDRVTSPELEVTEPKLEAELVVPTTATTSRPQSVKVNIKMDGEPTFSSPTTPENDNTTPISVETEVEVELENVESKEDLWHTIQEDGWIQGALIGAGSFGNVYLGLLSSTSTVVAVKQVTLPASVESRQTNHQVRALEREIDLMKELHHPNVVQYLGSDTTPTHLNIFLEYVSGGSVAARLAERGPFSELRCGYYCHQILKGLEYLHRYNIIHRDIKGGNVLVDADEIIKITDFGVSKKVEDHHMSILLPKTADKSQRVSLQGSVFWMAPEVVKQTHYTRKADIWSLGCLVLEMLTGNHPFHHLNQMQAMFKIGMKARPDIPNEISDHAKSFLDLTLQPDHAKRPKAMDIIGHPFLTDIKPPESEYEDETEEEESEEDKDDSERTRTHDSLLDSYI